MVLVTLTSLESHRLLDLSYTQLVEHAAGGLLQLVIKAISGSVRIACSSLIITSLFSVVNRLEESSLSSLFIQKPD